MKRSLTIALAGIVVLALMLAAACKTLVRIPMPGGAESLNVAVAGSIALYLATVPLES